LRAGAGFFATVTHGMTDDRQPRGIRISGERRLRGYLIAALALALVGACVPLANAASGGAGAGPGASKRSSAHRTVHHAARKASPFAGRGMWIWYVSQSSGGSVASIIANAKRYGISTLMIKSGDGSGTWSQFTPQLISTLHANGLRVCGWQYVYGNNPVTEAHVGAAAAQAGADCLVIDAEGEYEGKYVQAQSYVTALRQLVGANFPVALAGFPYVDYHPGFPYSVFLGPGGAQYNAPQMYWADIGVTVDDVFAHTYMFNRIYQRTIAPLGQVSGSPRLGQIRRFRQLSRAYGARGLSWWDWQEASPGEWRALSQPVGTLPGFSPDASVASLGKGAKGDVVVWAQEHLVKAGFPVTIDGSFGAGMRLAVMQFQQAHSLPAIGLIGPATWQALLRYAPITVHWTKTGAHTATVSRAGAAVAVPKSASLPARGYEIGRSHGRGR
jgi:Putative peptidoglycan binding domain